MLHSSQWVRWSCFIAISPILCVSIDICWVALFYLILLPSLICASCTASKGRCNQNTAINPIPWFILANRKKQRFSESFAKKIGRVGIFLLVWCFMFGLGLVLCGEVVGLSTLDRLEVIILIVEVRWSPPFNTIQHTTWTNNNF